MSSYPVLTKALIQEAATAERNLPIRNSACRSRLLFHPQPTNRVCLFFHGFTAGPYQFGPMGDAFYRAGYNVLVPLLPGHGKAGNFSRTAPPPLPIDPKVYQNFALDWLKKAQALGKQVIVGGLSAGGTLAGWLALERAQSISKSLLFAPYLGSMSMIVDLYVRQSQSYFEWGKPDPTVRSNPGYGYPGFANQALSTVLKLGEEVMNKAERQAAAPTFIISSDVDFAVRNLDHHYLGENLRKRQPKTWNYRFPKALKVPHTMMTREEGNQYEHLLITMARAFVESDLTWLEVEEIALRMLQGKTFNGAVADLRLTQKVSPDMAAMMTMLDKRAIAISRNPSMRN